MSDSNTNERQRERLRQSRSWTDFPRRLYMQNPIVVVPAEEAGNNNYYEGIYASIHEEAAPWSNLSSLLPPLLVSTVTDDVISDVSVNRLRRSPGVPNLRELFEKEEEEREKLLAARTCMPSSFSYGELR